MSEEPVPRYEWRYLPRTAWIESEEFADCRNMGLRSDLVLTLVTDMDDHVVIHRQNPRPWLSPGEQPALATDRLNALLGAALMEPGGVFKALAAETMFLHSLQLATQAQASVFDLAGPTYDNKLLTDLLEPSLGWLLWTWQLESLLRIAGCTTALAHELVKCYQHNYPRNAQIFGALSIERHSVWSIVEDASRWGVGLENMTIHAPLRKCFERHGMLRCGTSRDHQRNNRRSTMTTHPTLQFGEALATRFVSLFADAWKNYAETHPPELLVKMTADEWTAGMQSGVLYQTLESLRDDTSDTLGRVLRMEVANSAQIRKEDNKFDLMLAGGSALLRNSCGYPSRFYAIVEHERGEHPEEELWKLLFWRADLKVIVMYDYTDEDQVNRQQKGKPCWLQDKKKLFTEMLTRFNEDQSQDGAPWKDPSFYLIVVGTWQSEAIGVLRWTFFQLTEAAAVTFPKQ